VTTAVSALQLLKLNRYCGQAEAIHLDEKRAFRRSSIEQAGWKAFVMMIIFWMFNAK